MKGIKQLFYLIIFGTLGFSLYPQYTSSVSIGSSYYDQCKEDITFVDGKLCVNNSCTGAVNCYDQKDVEYNQQDNTVTIHENDNRNYKTDNHYTTNNIIARNTGTSQTLPPALNACRGSCFRKGKFKDSRSCKKCLQAFSQTDGEVTESDFYVDIELSCRRCEKNPKYNQNCGTCQHFKTDQCEHSDSKCMEKLAGILKSKMSLGHDCVDCERIKADVEIAKQNVKVAQAQNRTGGFWQGLGTIATAFAPLLVEKERTKQVSACTNSYSTSGADVAMENRLAFEHETTLQAQNSLPLTTWGQIQASNNLSYLCNGGYASGMAGFMGPQYGLGGFSPYGGGMGMNVFPGFASGQGFQSGLSNIFGNVMGNIQGIVPNISFGANAQLGMGATAWSQGAQGYYGSDPMSQYPMGYNNVFDMGYGYNTGANNYSMGAGTGYQQAAPAGAFPF